MADNSNTWSAIAGAAAEGAATVAVDAARTKRQFRYQQRAMDKQQALNLETWNMQNAYNTPQQQMSRLQDAGLNPRLIYGSGASAPNMAGPLDAPTAPTQEAVAPNVSRLMQYYQIRQMDAQYQNTIMHTDVMQKTGALKNIEQGLKNLDLAKEQAMSGNYNLHAMFKNDLEKWTSLRARHLMENESTKGFQMDQLIDMRQKQSTGLDLDNAFKQHRNDLSKLGIYTSDHPAFRVLIQAAKRMNIDLGELIGSGYENLKYLMDLSPEQKIRKTLQKTGAKYKARE